MYAGARPVGQSVALGGAGGERGGRRGPRTLTPTLRIPRFLFLAGRTDPNLPPARPFSSEGFPPPRRHCHAGRQNEGG